jgi:fluoroacetyl-CoA thioesterase
MRCSSVRAAYCAGNPPSTGSIAPVIKNARIEHRRATPVGGSVEITATPSRGVAGSRLTFDVQAIDGSGQLVAAGQIDRAIVDRQRFLASVSADAGHQ